jgi:hypothetical protein
MPVTLRSGATYDTLKPAAAKRTRTGTKADAITTLTVTGDPSASAKSVTRMGRPGGRPGGPQMVRMDVDWGDVGEEGYHGMVPERAQALLRTLNPAMSFAINNRRHQFSIKSSGSFLRILFGQDGKVAAFSRR